MILKTRIGLLFNIILMMAFPIYAQIRITNQVCFHKAHHSSLYSEDWDIDNGGLLHFFIRNDGPQDRITDIRINSTNPNVRWIRHWPPILGAIGENNISSVTVKGMDTPFVKVKH